MHILEYSLRATQEIEEMERNRDMMEAYMRITAEHGPSQALIDFVNFDGKLSEELGVGIESFSVGAQHEILASKLVPDALDEAACESLAEKIDTFSKWLMTLGGATAGVVAAALLNSKTVIKHPTRAAKVVLGGVVAVMAGSAINMVNTAISGIYTYRTFDV